MYNAISTIDDWTRENSQKIDKKYVARPVCGKYEWESGKTSSPF